MTRWLSMLHMVVMIAFPVAAAAGELDFALVLDQSASMWGYRVQAGPRAGTLIANDRNALRIEASRDMLSILARDGAAGQKSRIAVVEFATKTARTIDLTSLDPIAQPLSPAELDRAVVASRLRDRRTAGGETACEDGTWNGCYTNTAAALSVATDMLQSAAVLPGHRRAVLLVTDGRPTQPGATIESLKADISRAAKKLSNAGIQLAVLGLYDGADSSYWDEFGPFWADLVGHEYVALASNEREISQFTQSLFGRLGGRTSSTDGGPMAMPSTSRRPAVLALTAM